MNIRTGMNANLYPFQKETVIALMHFLTSSSSKASYCANDAGLGKSLTAITAAINLDASTGGVLICCPAIMRLVWKDEINKWGRINVTHIPTINVIESQDDFELLLERYSAPTIGGYTIITYDQLAKNNNANRLNIAEYKFKLLIADENHATKNYSAKRTKAFYKWIWPMCEYHILQSATPFTKNVTDFYTACHAIMPDFPYFKSFMDFASRYSFQRITPYGVDYYGLKNAEELSQLIRKHFYIRFKKEVVLKELPPIQYQKIPLSSVYAVKPKREEEMQIGKALINLEELLIKDRVTTVQDAGTLEKKQVVTQEISRAIASIRRAQGEAKVKPSAEYIEELLDQDIPVVVFAWHKSVIAGLATELAKYKPLIITGETKPDDRQKAIKAFQAGETNLIILNIIAGGVGITLTRAENVVLVEQSYVPSDIYQAVSRCHRIGTKGQVTVHWMAVEGSIDEKILNIVMQRAREFKTVCD